MKPETLHRELYWLRLSRLWTSRRTMCASCLVALLLPLLSDAIAQAQLLPPGFTNATPCLDSWSFGNTNTWTSDLAYAPVSFTNLSASSLGQFWAVVVDSTNAAWLRYNGIENDGRTNLMLDRGSVRFWFAPHWAGTNEGGTGPGEWGRLLEVGAYTADASYGWWSLYVDPTGTTLYFSAQTNGATADYLSAPIAWTADRWHLIALTYSSTNVSLYLDGSLVTNTSGMTCWPGPEVLTNGFCIGSDSSGFNQAHGMFDQLFTYNQILGNRSISNTFTSQLAPYYLNPLNSGNISSAPSAPQMTPTFNAVTGPGILLSIATNTTCEPSSNVWITNITVAAASNGTMSITFSIAGGVDGAAYDVFANSLLDFSSDTNKAWAWMGQGQHCVTYTLTNLPGTACFLILGTPTDSDGDGLTDAYEKLVTKTDPSRPDTVGDGILDGWKVVWGLNPLADSAAQSALRANYGYNPTDWLDSVFGVRSGSVGLDAEGNVLSVSQ